jgi:bifunctional non-homologous end joining protein LigD
MKATASTRSTVSSKSPAAPSARPAVSSARTGAGTPTKANIAGIAISHPEKLYFPDESITKAEIATYYERMAELIVPHTKDRPLALVRCPDGWNRQCFFQKHADKSVNAAVDRIDVPEGEGTATYMSASSASGLVGLVQWGVIEMHPWGSRRPHLDRPDRLIFDFDPDDAIAWPELVKDVQLLRTLLEDLDLQAFIKTTGGKGLHVIVPIRATLDWEHAKGFSRAVADFLVRTFGDRFIATASKTGRKGKVFIDYLRNAVGATAIAPYGVRARAGAPVAMPVAWDELGADVRFDHFNVRSAEQHVTRRKRDPWHDFATTRQSITKAHGKKMGFEL